MKNHEVMLHVGKLLDRIGYGDESAEDELIRYTKAHGMRDHGGLDHQGVALQYMKMKQQIPGIKDKQIAAEIGIDRLTLTRIKQEFGIGG